MLGAIGATDVQKVDDAVNRFRALVERALPWLNPEEEAERSAETERVRLRSVRARIRAEDVIASYRRADGTYRR